MSRHPLILAVCLSAVASLACATGAPAFELAPHEAHYGFALGAKRGASPLIGAEGEMTIRLEKACDGWMLSQKVTLITHSATGESARQETVYAGFEAFDGSRYRFSGSHREEGVNEEFRGSAQSGMGGGQVKLTKPEARNLTLPAGTLFPVGHTLALIERAEAGEQQLTRMVYDGADEDGLKETAAFIGPRQAAPVGPEAGGEPLLTRPGWTMRMAMFGKGAPGGEPEFEVELLQLDNGVAPRIRLDYGSFAVDARLKKLAALAPPGC